MTPRPRPRFTPGGGDAFLAYAAFGDIALDTPLDPDVYHAAGVPDGFDFVQYDRAVQPDGFAHLQTGPAWDLAAADAPALARAAEAGPHAVVLSGIVADPPALDYLRDAVGILMYLFDRGAAAVFDLQCFQLWSADGWKAEVFAATGPHPHTVILASPEGPGRTWYHTRGMRKFGRPDLSVRGVGPAHGDAVIELFNRFIEYQADGGTIRAGEVLRMPGLPPGGLCVPAGSFDDPEFLNEHVAFVWADGLS